MSAEQEVLSMQQVAPYDASVDVDFSDTDQCPGAVYQIKPNEKIIKATTASASDVAYLPPVDQAAGGLYTVEVCTDGGSLSLQDKDDSLGWSDITFADENDYVLLYSNGYRWIVIKDAAT